MSANTLNLPFKRFVAQVSTAPARSKSTYLALMEENLAALQKCPWKEAADVPAALTDHDFTASTYISDAYDAFKMTGNYSASTMTEIAYAGMAAYRFKIPDSALASGSEVALSSITLPVSRDRYLKSGVRVAAVLSDSAAPSADWDVVRGSGGILLSAQLPQSAAYLLAGAPGKDTLELAASSFAGLAETGHAYLWIYLTLEDYTEHWDMYSANEQRLYAVEGSAMLVGGSAEFTFAGEVTADSPPSAQQIELLAGGDSPTWIQPLVTRNAGTTAPSVASQIDMFFRQASESPVPIANHMSLSFPVNESQNSGGPDAYTGKVQVSTQGASIASVKLTLNADVANPQWTPMTRGETDSADFVSWSWTVGDGDLEPGEEYRNLSVALKIARAQGYQYKLVIGGLFYTYSVAHVSTTGAFNFTTYSYNLDGDATFTAFSIATFWLMLRFSGITTSNGGAISACAISDADRCDQQDADTRQGAETGITIVTANSEWRVVVSGITYTVKLTGANTITVSGGLNGSDALCPAFFDPAAAIWRDEPSLGIYGVAATIGDFSHAIVAYEQGTQPSHAEMLGRLVRNSRRRTGEILYLHPANGALADELDVLRPVPRFYRVASGEYSTIRASQTSCQPGLSVWYKRPSAGSGYLRGVAYKGGVVPVVPIANHVFLQYALLALRTPAAADEGMQLVLKNTGASDVVNGFKLRFAVWSSPAEEWDGSNNYALSAIVAAPCLYRADGVDSVSWSVDNGGAFFPFGIRTVHAQRVGVSDVVSGNIAVDAEIPIRLSASVSKNDVLLIAPVVDGFADGQGAVSVYFGRQSDPSNATTGWARYTTDLGWFPQITLEP